MGKKIFDPAASVVCHRARFVLITALPGKEKRTDTEAGKRSRLRESGGTEGAVRLLRVAICNFIREGLHSHKISFHPEELSTVCALNLAPGPARCKLFFSPPQTNFRYPSRTTVHVITVCCWVIRVYLQAQKNAPKSNKRTRLHNQPGSLNKLTDKNYFSGASLWLLPHAGEASPAD